MIKASGEKKWRPADYGYVIAMVSVVWLINVAWLSKDTRPPVWDMALHQSYALNYWPGEDGTRIASRPWAKSGNYPPFVHVLIASCYAILHPGPHIAILANIPATFILFWAIYCLSLEWAGRNAARWACFVTAMVPYLLWMSRETILDYWLSAWVGAALVALHWTRGFSARGPSLLFGLVLALGLLTKWIFAGFILLPLTYEFVRNRVWRHGERLIHFMDSLLVAGITASVWYLPNLPKLVLFFGENARIGAQEGEPPVFSYQSFIYYLRLLEGYQLFALLFVLLILACVEVWRRGLLSDGRLLFVAVAGGWLAMTLLRTKDPRFTMPLLGLLAILPGAWIQTWGPGWLSRAAKLVLVATLAFQAYLVNFGVSWLPARIVLAEGYQGSLRWDWNLYLQDYFHVLGSPKREDWKQRTILEAAALHAGQNGLRMSIALVPDLPRFNATNFQLYARLLGIRADIGRVQQPDDGIRAFERFDYVLMTEGDQGMPWSTVHNAALNQLIVDDPRVFQLVELYELPNGDSVRLYSIRRE